MHYPAVKRAGTNKLSTERLVIWNISDIFLADRTKIGTERNRIKLYIITHLTIEEVQKQVTI